MTQSKDSNKSRLEGRISSDLGRRFLKKGAVPSLFPDLPKYFSKHGVQPRSGNATSQARLQRQQEAYESAATAFLDNDKLTSFEELRKRLTLNDLPPGFAILDQESGQQLLLFMIDTSFLKGPEILFCLQIESTLDFKMWYRSKLIPNSDVKHIVKCPRFNSLSQIQNVAAYLKSHASSTEFATTVNGHIQQACEILKEALVEDMDEKQKASLCFLIEQLQLLGQSPHAHRFSAELMVMAAGWQITSPVLYRQILDERLLCLPCMKYLRRLMGALTVDAGLSSSTISYLKARMATLDENDKLLCLMIDEVSNEKRVEYVGGRFFGGGDATCTKSLLCFMVKSVAGRYRDMIAMLPLERLDAKVLATNFQWIVKALANLGFTVVAVSVDGYSANRRFYEEELCSGKNGTLSSKSSTSCLPYFPSF